ncbi:MAG: OmpA family protein [Flavobacteriales bacterium]|nr:OmpA family protein [Flavobacteriales bacterium]
MKGASFCLLFLAFLTAVGQQKKGDKLFEKKLYQKAAEAYIEEIETNPSNIAVYQNLGETYAALRDYTKAEEAYKKALNSDKLGNEKYINYAFSLIKMGRYNNAKQQFKQYNSIVNDSLQHNEYVELCDSLMAWSTRNQKYSIKTITGINTSGSEFAPTPYKKGILYAANGKTDWVNYVSDKATRNNYLDIHLAIKGADNWTFSEQDLLSPRLSTTLHDGPATIDSSEQKIYFTRLFRTPKKEVLHIFVAEMNADKIQKTQPFEHNSNEYSVIHPAFSDNNQLLFFASNQPTENKGGFDIYYCQKKADGSWANPKPIEGAVNSIGNELFPYYRNGVLYFSSDGHYGYGGLDLFSSKSADNYDIVTNLHAPINSHDDDFSIMFIDDEKGYFASDRPGGKGLDDIYGFEAIAGLEKQQLKTISGVFEFNKLPQAGALIALYDENGTEIMRVITSENGFYSFSNLEPDKSYSIRPIEDNDYGEIYIIDEDKKKVMLLDKNASFHFENHSSERENGITFIQINDPTIVAKKISGYIFKKVKGDYGTSVAVFVYDELGNIIATTNTDKNGVFSFETLNREQQYIVKIEESDVELQIEIESISKSVNKHLVNMNGVFVHNKLPLAGEVMALFNEEGVEMFRTTTDKNGRFKFRSIEPDTKYSIHPINDIEDSDVYMTNEIGHKTHLLMKSAVFRFTTLKSQNINGMQSITINDPEMIANPIKGYIYRTMKGDYNGQMNIIVYDAAGNLVTSSATNKQGEFNFESLGKQITYLIQIDESDGELVMEITGMHKLVEYGFTQLSPEEIAEIIPIDLEDASFISKPFGGYVFQKIKGDYSGRTEILAYDDQGKVIARTYTDENGNFTFQNLPPQNTYLFKVLVEDTDIQLGFIDTETQKVSQVAMNKNGEFTYERLTNMQETIDIINEKGVVIKIKNNELFSNSKIYYDYDKSSLSIQAKTELDKLVTISQQNPHILFALGSHTDSQGEESYNLLLSERRAKSALDYLLKKGVQKSQISFIGYGESNPIIDDEKIDLLSSDIEKEAAHAKNRRTDIKITAK